MRPDPSGTFTTASDAPQTSLDVELLGVTKVFGDTPAVRDLTLHVQHGTFFSLLGPSGCGKTTTLRLIAGFEQPTSGQVIIGGTDVAGLPPYRRDVNTVFQHYALFPHMSVADNIAYGLRQRGAGRAEIQRRVAEALQMVRLPGADRRRPAELSGGQQQRVALARALINRPTVLLLDEPLSALDLKLRKEMQSELKTLQQSVGITFIYVTHDQDEAITLSDRMAVMNAGRLEQEGTPAEIYERPRTRFVADFIGLTNFLDGTVRESAAAAPDGAAAARVVVETALGAVTCAGWQPDVRRGERVTLTLRPEKIRLLAAGAEPGPGWNVLAGIVTQATFLGPQNEYRVRVGDESGVGGRELNVRQQNISTLTADEALDGRAGGTDSGWRAFAPGERVAVTWRYEASLILRDPGSDAQQTESAQGSAPVLRASVTS
jgi:spermidine/putrescine transport system ATP-binding protein